jgi:hypothetical protein
VSTSGSLLNSTVNIADLSKSPQNGCSEYQGFRARPGPLYVEVQLELSAVVS